MNDKAGPIPPSIDKTFEKRAAFFAQKVMNGQGTMKVIHANDTIREIFEVTGFSDILTIE